jgi:hypothetical protein
MIKTHTSLTWGEEIAPLEMQNTKGGDWIVALLVAGFIDLVAHFFENGGDLQAACVSTGADLSSVMALIQSTLSWQIAN